MERKKKDKNRMKISNILNEAETNGLLFFHAKKVRKWQINYDNICMKSF